MLSAPLQLVSDISNLIIKYLVSLWVGIKRSTGGKSCLRNLETLGWLVLSFGLPWLGWLKHLPLVKQSTVLNSFEQVLLEWGTFFAFPINAFQTLHSLLGLSDVRKKLLVGDHQLALTYIHKCYIISFQKGDVEQWTYGRIISSALYVSWW